jgi:hypothetical protein
MSAATTLAGAAPDVVPGWHSIDWKKVWQTGPERRYPNSIENVRCI